MNAQFLYQQVKKNDTKKEELAQEYSNENMKFSKEDMTCYGCRDINIKNSKMCGICSIRICAEDRKLQNCGYCKEYPCVVVKNHIPEDSDNRVRLNRINESIPE